MEVGAEHSKINARKFLKLFVTVSFYASHISRSAKNQPLGKVFKKYIPYCRAVTGCSSKLQSPALCLVHPQTPGLPSDLVLLGKHGRAVNVYIGRDLPSAEYHSAASRLCIQTATWG